MTAVRDIPAGAEIVARYCEPLPPSAQRQQFLRTNYGFTCADPAASDARRAQIRQWEHLLDDDDSSGRGGGAALARWIGDATLPDDHLTAPLLAVLALIEAEGVQNTQLHPLVLKRLADAYAALGDRERLAEYAGRFVRAGATTMYVAQRRTEKMVRDFSSPGRYPFWNKRVKYRGPGAAQG